MFKYISNYFKKSINKLSIIFKDFWNLFLIFMKNFIFYFLIFVKYFSIIFSIFLLIMYSTPINFQVKNLNITESIINLKNTNPFRKEYLNYDGYLLKYYSYYWKNGNCYIKSNFQKQKFIINNNYYDDDCNYINENNKNNYIKNIKQIDNLLIKININNNFLNLAIKDILFIYKIFKKIIFKIHTNENANVIFDYVYFRWNVVIIYGDYKYTIKLPEIMDNKIIDKILYIEKNLHNLLKGKNMIFDLRFEDIIVV
jgi:hypothetical protein